VTSSLAVLEAAIRIKSTHLIKSCLKTRKKRKYGNKRNFLIKLHLKYRLDIKFTACYSDVMPGKALTSFTVSDAYSQFAGQP